MSIDFDFEEQVSALEKKIIELRNAAQIGDIDVANEITRMQNKIDRMLTQIYQKLTPWQTVQVSRHPDRPKFTYYLDNIFEDFIEIAGDRLFADDQAIITGFATIDNIKCCIIGQEKGIDTESRLKHNFGMPKPEGYRKAIRIMDLANKFNLPILTFIDTAGAYPGLESEERGVAEAIAKCMEKSFQLKVPFISTIIGEGGSGGAIAIATADKVLMFEHSIYSVISPEGCASILWKDETKNNLAAEVQKLTAKDLKALGVIDEIVKEPIGGAHRNKKLAADTLKQVLIKNIQKELSLDSKSRQIRRRQKFKTIGDEFLIM